MEKLFKSDIIIDKFYKKIIGYMMCKGTINSILFSIFLITIIREIENKKNILFIIDNLQVDFSTIVKGIFNKKCYIKSFIQFVL